MPSAPHKLITVFLPFAAGYFLSYLFRVVNAVIAPDLIADLQLNPSRLGLLTSVYFISFASAQPLLGVLLDRFGPRIINAGLLLVAGAGAAVFALAHSFTGVLLGRALIGLGVSACLMAAFKAYVIWFPKKMWPRINGFQMAAGALGALTATTPVAWALGITDWRGIFMGLAGLCVLTSGLVFKLVPVYSRPVETPSFRHQIRGIKQVFTSPSFLKAAPVTTLSQAGFLSIQGLWAGPWMRDVAGMDPLTGAHLLSIVALSMMAGFIGLGFLSEQLSRRDFPVLHTAVAGMSIFMVAQALLLLAPVSWAAVVWPLFGFFGTSGIIAYAGLCHQFPQDFSGRVTTAINLMVFVTAFAGQWAMGGIINLWDPAPGGGYAVAGYQWAFALVLILQVLALGWFVFYPGLPSPHPEKEKISPEKATP